MFSSTNQAVLHVITDQLFLIDLHGSSTTLLFFLLLEFLESLPNHRHSARRGTRVVNKGANLILHTFTKPFRQALGENIHYKLSIIMRNLISRRCFNIEKVTINIFVIVDERNSEEIHAIQSTTIAITVRTTNIREWSLQSNICNKIMDPKSTLSLQQTSPFNSSVNTVLLVHTNDELVSDFTDG